MPMTSIFWEIDKCYDLELFYYFQKCQKIKMILFIYFLTVVKSEKRCPDPETFEDCVNDNLDSLYERFTKRGCVFPMVISPEFRMEQYSQRPSSPRAPAYVIYRLDYIL